MFNSHIIRIFLIISKIDFTIIYSQIECQVIFGHLKDSKSERCMNYCVILKQMIVLNKYTHRKEKSFIRLNISTIDGVFK